MPFEFPDGNYLSPAIIDQLPNDLKEHLLVFNAATTESVCHTDRKHVHAEAIRLIDVWRARFPWSAMAVSHLRSTQSSLLKELEG